MPATQHVRRRADAERNIAAIVEAAVTAFSRRGDPKTASSHRAIDLTAPTLDLLRTHRARTAERMLAVGDALTDDDLVFCDDAGQPLWGRHVTTRQLKRLLRDAGLPPIRFQDLRQTFAGAWPPARPDRSHLVSVQAG